MIAQTFLDDSTTNKQQIGFAMRLCEIKEYAQAESYLQSLVKQQSQNAHAWYLLSFIAAQNKQYSQAIQYIQKAITINPQESSFYNNLGNLYLNQKQFERAVKCYRKAISLQPEAYNLYRSLGLAYLMQENMVAANFNYGVAYEKQDNLAEATRYYLKVIKAQPDYVLAYYNLGNVYRQQKKLEQAIECYQQVTQLRPDNVKAYYYLATIYQEEKAFAQAIYNYEQVIKRQPNHGEAHLNLSIIYHQQGNLDKAFQTCQDALKHYAENVQYNFALDRDLVENKQSSSTTSVFEFATSPSKLLPTNKSLTNNNSLLIEKSVKNNHSLLAKSQKELDLATLQKILEQKNYQRQLLQSQNLLDDNIPQNSSLVKYVKKVETIIPVILEEEELNPDFEEEEEEDNFNYLNYDSIYHQHSVFYAIQKNLIAQRFLDNKYRFLVTSFITPEQAKNKKLLINYLEQTELSYCIYQIPQVHQSSSVIGEINCTNYTTPNYLASIYEDLKSKQLNYTRKFDFTHILYLDSRFLMSFDSKIPPMDSTELESNYLLPSKTIEFLKISCDRNIDFLVYNWIKNFSQSLICELEIDSKFLFSSSSVQLYSLSQQSLWIWEVWQEAIIKYINGLSGKNVPLVPSDETFLDYAWNNILCHIPKIKYTWLGKNYLSCDYTPLARTLIS